jgi:hypothetical protein
MRLAGINSIVQVALPLNEHRNDGSSLLDRVIREVSRELGNDILYIKLVEMGDKTASTAPASFGRTR